MRATCIDVCVNSMVDTYWQSLHASGLKMPIEEETQEDFAFASFRTRVLGYRSLFVTLPIMKHRPEQSPHATICFAQEQKCMHGQGR